MITLDSYYLFIRLWILLAVIIFFILLFVSAPYGRHTRKNWGIRISNRLGWIFMELPSLLTFSFFFFTGSTEKKGMVLFFALLWIAHYFHRSLIFPFRIQIKDHQMPLAVMFMAVFFNLVNGFINGFYLGNLYVWDHQQPGQYWLIVLGGFLFFAGSFINLWSDQILIQLRKKSSAGYVIPHGGFFRWISSPNYFGEIIEWLGFAVMVNALPAWAFFIWTLSNLVPRALKHQKWYRKNFPDYPPERKAIIPFIW